MTPLACWILLVVLSGSCRTFSVDSSSGSPEIPYYDESCSNVPSCYCYLSGDEYQADCADPSLLQIPPDLSYNITALHVTGTLLFSLDSDDFVPYLDLKIVNLASNRLHAVDPGSLDTLIGLESFVVNDNFLDDLSPDILKQNLNLIYFDASNNKLVQMPNFRDLTKLVEVYLGYNQISTIDYSLFDGCSSLRIINLEHNDITVLPGLAFDGAPGVEFLDLSSNRIRELTFANMDQLKDLVLRNNSLTSLNANVFSGDVLLRSLDLSNNSIAYINSETFEGLTSLEILQLNGNNLSSIPNVALSSLLNVRTLYLGNNPLPEIPAGAFSGIESLKELFLNGMPTLGRFDPDALHSLSNLERLSLANNPNLVEFTPNHLPVGQVPRLQTIYLNGDGFVYLDRAIFDDKPDLQLVDLFDNKFNCSCDLKWMPRVVQDRVS